MPNIYNTGGYWGDAINIIHWPEDEFDWGQIIKVVGWKRNKPEVGDVLRIPCQSGKVMLGKFIFVEYERDPRDMFFANVELTQYE